ncbi:MAG TPA: DUF4383 domain-containing protein [Candidatus Limnocylindrales bacterium]|jgi:hypothetical protein|nr:DUF4383 domain-containing protein [Candidatus Limnocylindrales bacterium]
MSLVRIVVLVFGAVYVLVGLMGFLGDPFVTGSDHGNMPSAEGDLLGIFPINALHNVVHLVIGAALLYGATAHDRAVLVARIVGGVYLVVGLLGFVAPDTFGLMPIGGPDIALHLATAAILLGVTFIDRPADARRA